MNSRQGFIYPLIFLFCTVYVSACHSQTGKAVKGKAVHTNRLINSTSPYLLQHAYNPVDWFPWGEEALQKAKEEGKLLIISVGYAACHWCHVMEHESFEDSTVANLMNEHFVSIKVDREERPDIDQIYMNAAYLTAGKGGWPLNAIALPDGRPLFAATYFPKKDWLRMLNFFIKKKSETPEELEDAARKMTEGIQEINLAEMQLSKNEWEIEVLNKTADQLLSAMDVKKGGLKEAPKFPMPSMHRFLLRHHFLSEDPKSLEAVTTTLDEMAKGGIYDQVGGGFARYSTDAIWKVPHFEKMLYDNSQLVSLYSEAYQLTKNPEYKRIVFESLEFIQRELTDPSGGFYSSLDADSEGEEGKFYVWTQEEIEQILGEEAKYILELYNVKAEGNWEGHNILYKSKSNKDVALSFDLSDSQFEKILQRAKKKLLKAREERVRPGLDDKVLTSWNALMIMGYLDAYRAFGEEAFLEVALKNAAFLKKNMLRKDGGLNRSYKDGKSSINGFSDDYSFLIEAFVSLYQSTFEEAWLFEAEKLMEYCLTHFYDEKTGMFYYTSDLDKALITRTREISDNVIPGANSSLAKGLFYLGTYLYREDYLGKARQMLSNVEEQILSQPAYHSNWAWLLSHLTHPPYEVAIVGENWKELRQGMDQNFLPHVFYLGGKKEGKLK
ncbi:MAG: thioredoxin domain-containing protein, partial [Bacteroidota bacterium]